MTLRLAMRFSRRFGIVALGCCAWIALGPIAAVEGGADLLATRLEPAPGRYLVATRQVRGPIFGRSIIVLIGADERGAAGLIVNRPSSVALGDVFDELPEGRADLIHLGGPGEPKGMLLLLRTAKASQAWQKIRGDLYLGQEADALRSALREGPAPDRMRAFVGHAGWAPGQLEHEIERGDWFVIERDVELAFDASWEELIRSLEAVRARLPGGSDLCCAHDTPRPSDPRRRLVARLSG